MPIACLLIVCACKKSDSHTTQGLPGTWIFLGATVHSQTTADEGGGVTLMSTTNLVTKNNVGTISFKTDSMVVSGLGYSVDTSIIAYFYYNHVLYDSVQQPLNYTIQPTSANAKYSVIGSDSLYLPSGGLLSQLDSSSTGRGCKYQLMGDSLTLTENGIDTTGGAQTLIQAVMSLKRQK